MAAALAIKETDLRTKERAYTVVAKRHVVEKRSEYHFAVLGPNPDYGKQGVCYSGEFYTVCTTDGIEEAKRIARALDVLQAIDAIGEAPILDR